MGKYKSVKHYELISTKNGSSKLTDLINISKDRNCAKSSPVFWLQIRKGNKWVKPRLTGLFKTSEKGFFKGDLDKRRCLLIFQFVNDGLVIYCFENYYPKNLNSVFSVIEEFIVNDKKVIPVYL
ncbi:hypothetical protein [Cellulophaga sp. 2_MG-2023]|uniref:hypothetical protein n=1 Tax=Cellulophaga sp. 2_MG-2023 TaxID=3062674 RepID=UPI0026E2BDD6|nr:hypothetical protein [Cellulophaga sp. 2_MG-2023]MDO6491777.1 hypothetical protein [Cellulophaga sp. 2_MG-2023]MDO6495568.1 hypothetical protein [Cellulophaga sp. 3_MG-2023]